MHCSQLLSKIGSVSLFSLCCVSSRHRSMEDRERRRVTLSDRNPFKRPAITSFSLSVTFVQNLVQTLNTKASDVLQKKKTTVVNFSYKTRIPPVQLKQMGTSARSHLSSCGLFFTACLFTRPCIRSALNLESQHSSGSNNEHLIIDREWIFNRDTGDWLCWPHMERYEGGHVVSITQKHSIRNEIAALPF